MLKMGHVLLALGVAVMAGYSEARAESPRDFIEKAYAAEAHEYGGGDDMRGFVRLFDQELGGLIKRDRREAGGEVPNLDYDPICQCQDDAGLHYVVLSAHEGDEQATVVVRNSYGAGGDPPVTVTYRLRRSAGGWRIADVQTADVPSLRRWLKSQLDQQKRAAR